jgi:hypothetical protein
MSGMNAHWSEVVLAHPCLGEAACLTWIRDLDPIEALRRLGGCGPFPACGLPQLNRAVLDRWVDGRGHVIQQAMPPIGALADWALGGWTLIVEPNGWAGTVDDSLLKISKGTMAVSVFWNIEAVGEINVARNGQAAAVVHDCVMFAGNGGTPRWAFEDVEGTDPGLVKDLVAGLARLPDLEWQPVAFRWIEKFAGTGVPAGWLDEAHPSTLFSRENLGEP